MAAPTGGPLPVTAAGDDAAAAVVGRTCRLLAALVLGLLSRGRRHGRLAESSVLKVLLEQLPSFFW